VPCIEEQTRVSIKNILLATTSSEFSEAILPYVAALARRYGARISLSDAISPEAISEIVNNREVDMVVVASRRKLRDTATPSIGEDILPTVLCPVLVIGPEVTYTELANKALERIVYVTDFSISSLEALPYAVTLAQDNEAQLTLVHIAEETTMGPFYYGDSRSVAFRKRLESLVSANSGFLCESEFVVGNGDRAEGLVRIAANLDASLIVMSVRGTPAEAFARVLRPVDGQLICRAQCPVLMVSG
jgi:nucleotide-binding universal stress UspA family protein